MLGGGGGNERLVVLVYECGARSWNISRDPKDDAEAVLGVHMNLRVEFGEEFCCGFHMSIRTSQDLYHAFALQSPRPRTRPNLIKA